MLTTKSKERLRMVRWLLVAVLLYAFALILLDRGYSGPIQTIVWKLGHVTLGGYAGYWLDRAAFRDRITAYSQPLVMVRRAIIITGAMFTLGLGL
ncbi:hypothetical protein B0920_02150 [Massilia sp. KIM]|uniref:putative holin n=1 Tax=Massilia sp. KIM TaxID=1955422 RepID=UPI00098FB383|nr:putative holin [Massilia sp. KIM]OON62302.1 hypothetical protein B0920_02150 [Massilia sp. KIM]